ncbi:hypothetical protein evm_005676 [Chilo suppressalis]|nr:hypothetical protein evm_005676 [Chilo suppressalis]
MNIEALIAKVFLNPAVWDKRDKNHANRNVVDRCWQNIAGVMGVEEAALRKKWKYLRDQFCVEFSKIKQPRSGDPGGETSHDPKWPHYRSLLFLKDIVRPRASSGNLREPSQETYTEAAPINAQEEFIEINDEFHNVSEDLNEDLSEGDPCSMADVPQAVTKEVKKTQKRRHDSNAKYNAAIIEIETKKAKLLEDTLKNRQTEDDDLLFFRALLPHVKKIPPHRKLRFRNRVQEVVDEFAYNHDNLSPSHLFQPTYYFPSYDSSSHPTPSPPTTSTVPIDIYHDYAMKM